MDCSCPVSFVHRISREEHWSAWPFPSPGDLFRPRTEPASPALQADSWPLSVQRILITSAKILFSNKATSLGSGVTWTFRVHYSNQYRDILVPRTRTTPSLPWGCLSQIPHPNSIWWLIYLPLGASGHSSNSQQLLTQQMKKDPDTLGLDIGVHICSLSWLILCVKLIGSHMPSETLFLCISGCGVGWVFLDELKLKCRLSKAVWAKSL